MTFHQWVTAAVLAACVVSTGCGKKPQKDVVARVGDVIVTRDDFRNKLESLPPQLRAVVLANKREFIADMASELFLVREAERRKVDELTDVTNLLEAARKKILVAKLVDIEVDKKVEVTPEDVAAYYEAHKQEFFSPQVYRASHILVKGEAEASALKTELDNGADFEGLARKYSVDQTAIRGGDLGFFQKGQFVPEFEEAVLAMKKGETSKPVKSRFGYHIIRLTDSVEPTLREFSAVKGAVEEKLRREKRSAALKALVDKLKAGSEVSIDEKALEAALPKDKEVGS